jgi:hypothetical protein
MKETRTIVYCLECGFSISDTHSVPDTCACEVTKK